MPLATRHSKTYVEEIRKAGPRRLRFICVCLLSLRPITTVGGSVIAVRSKALTSVCSKGERQTMVLPMRGGGWRGNIEAIRLYREILKATRLFHWCNEKGEPWGRILRESARKEFEQARHETDPLIVARLLVVGRQCLNDTIRGLEKTEKRIADKVKETRNR